MQEVFLSLASLVSIVVADRLVQTYVRSRVRREACRGVAGVAMALLGVGLATMAFGYFRDWGGEGGPGVYATLFKTSFFLQHAALPVVAVSASMHLGYVAVSLAIAVAAIAASLALAAVLSWSEVNPAVLERGESSALFPDPLPAVAASALAVSGALVATAFYLKAYRMRGGRDGAPYLAAVLGLAVMALALVAESLGSVGTLESSILKLAAAVALAYGLASARPPPGPLC